MKTIKVVEATERQLDWLVAYAQGRTPTLNMNSHGRVWHGWWLATGGEYERMPNYSNDWAQGGPILERENISVGYQGHLGVPLDSLWYATNRVDACGFGQKPLTAVLRCFVNSKLGDTVEVPDELL